MFYQRCLCKLANLGRVRTSARSHLELFIISVQMLLSTLGGVPKKLSSMVLSAGHTSTPRYIQMTKKKTSVMMGCPVSRGVATVPTLLFLRARPSLSHTVLFEYIHTKDVFSLHLNRCLVWRPVWHGDQMEG